MLASVCICTWNRATLLDRALAALSGQRIPSGVDWEVLVVNNGCSDHTDEIIARWASSLPIRRLHEPAMGLSNARNRAVLEARGDLILWADDDIIVGPGWVGHYAEAAVEWPDVAYFAGSVTPRFAAVPPSWIRRHLEHLQGPFAACQPGLVVRPVLPEEFPFAANFAVRAEVMKRLPFDSRLGRKGLVLISGEDSDLILRLKQLDYPGLWVGAAAADHLIGQDRSTTQYIHDWYHGHGRTIARMARLRGSEYLWDTPRGMGRRRRIAAIKAQLLSPTKGSGWFRNMRDDAYIGGILEEHAEAESRARAPAVPRPKISLTMIVRDEEANLPECLSSADGLFDELIVVDTGSTDCTAEVALSLGAKVSHFAWEDDFAEARNAALAQATGDYVFWLDADDRIDPGERVRLRTLLSELSGNDAAYVMRCACRTDDARDYILVDHVRLFPNRPGVRWEYRVHEQVIPSLLRAGTSLRWTDVTIRHTGYDDAQGRRLKADRNLALLAKDLGDRPHDPFVLLNCARVCIERGDARAALEHLQIRLAAPLEKGPMARDHHALTAQAHLALGEFEVAIAACAAGLSASKNDAELLSLEADARYRSGDRDGAEEIWGRILSLKRPDRFTCASVGLYGHATRRKLAESAEERGEYVRAFKLWTEVLNECPEDPAPTHARTRIARKLLASWLGAAKSFFWRTRIAALIAAFLVPQTACEPTSRSPRSSAGRVPRQGSPAETLLVSPDPIRLGPIECGSPAQAALKLTNPHGMALAVARVETTCPCISVSPVPLRIDPGGSSTLTVAFDPSESPDFRGDLAVGLKGIDAAGVEMFRSQVGLTVRGRPAVPRPAKNHAPMGRR